MTQDPEQTTGTPETDDGDAAEDSQTTGTPNQDGRDATQEPDYKALHLANKDTIATLTAKVAELAQQVGSQPATEPADERAELDAAERDLREAERLHGVDPLARIVLRERRDRIKERDHDRREMADAMVLQRIPQEKQKATVEFYLKNQNRFADLAAAAEAYNGRELTSTVANLQKELADAKKQLANGGAVEKNRDDVVRTHGVDTSTPTHKARTWTQEQYDAEYAKLEREGGIRATLDLSGKLRRGEILLKR